MGPCRSYDSREAPKIFWSYLTYLSISLLGMGTEASNERDAEASNERDAVDPMPARHGDAEASNERDAVDPMPARHGGRRG